MRKISKQQMIEDLVMPDMASHARGILALLIEEELRKFAGYVDGLQWSNGRVPTAKMLVESYLKSKEA